MPDNAARAAKRDALGNALGFRQEPGGTWSGPCPACGAPDAQVWSGGLTCAACQLLDMGEATQLYLQAPRDDQVAASLAPEEADPAHGDLEEGVRLDDFFAYMPMHSYIFVPCRDMWPASSVNARIEPVGAGKKEMPASKWLDQYRPVEQMTWAPGEPMVIADRLISGGGWIERSGCRTFNLYLPPTIKHGEPERAVPWLDHVRYVFPESAEHILTYLAHRVQRPDEKINHALVLIGPQGTGKDTIIAGAIPAVGPWNVQEVSPDQLMGRFNGFIKSVILRVSEARDLGDSDRYRLYEHLKTYTASPPDVLRCDEKNIREYSVPNVCGVVITSNHTDGIYLPADDRRHYVAITERTKEDFDAAYFDRLYRWYDAGGYGHVAAYLASRDLSTFAAKAPPPKTAAFWRVVDAGRAPEDAELADALDRLSEPPALTLTTISRVAEQGFGEWLRDRRNSRAIPHRMELAGYVPIRNDGAKDGRFKVAGRRQVIYARRDLSIRDRLEAVAQLTGTAPPVREVLEVPGPGSLLLRAPASPPEGPRTSRTDGQNRPDTESRTSRTSGTDQGTICPPDPTAEILGVGR